MFRTSLFLLGRHYIRRIHLTKLNSAVMRAWVWAGAILQSFVIVMPAFHINFISPAYGNT